METRYKVLDTNIFLLGDPKKALLAFRHHRDDVRTILLIPHVVIDELDQIKSEKVNGRQTSRAKEAQAALKLLDHYIVKDPEHPQNPLKGVDIGPNYEFIYVPASDVDPSVEKEVDKSITNDRDARIIKIALQYLKKSNGNLEFVSNDFGARQRARLFGIPANEWESIRDASTPQEDPFKGYKGYRTLVLSRSTIDEFLAIQGIPVSSIEESQIEGIVANEFVLINEEDSTDAKPVVIGVYDHKQKALVQIVEDVKTSYGGIRPKNAEQAFALKALMDPTINLVHLIGPAGSGKTLIALAAAIEQSVTNDTYETIRVVRPTISIGPEMGFLPGDERAKLDPWMRAIYSNLTELRVSVKRLNKKREVVGTDSRRIEKPDIEGYIKAEKILLTPLSPVRGDTFRGSFMVIDEGQNFTPDEMKTLLTRAGRGTKIVVTGDPWQIDHPNLDVYNNGLVHSAERMRGLDYVATVYLSKGERSRLATDASRRL